MTLSKLRVVLEASVGGFNSAMRASGRVMSRMLNSVKALSAGIFNLGNVFKAMLVVMAARKLFEVARSIFDIGAAVGETQAKFDAVFGEGSQKVQDFIEDFATMAGATRQAAQDMLSDTGQIVQGMGITQAASADLSIQVLKTAGDWASFRNVGVAETLLKINAALTGERESLKRMGAVILEVDVQQRAMHENSLTSIKDITQEMKVLATLNILREKSGVVLGDLVRTQDSAANRAKQLGAAWGNLRNTAATILLPMFVDVLDSVTQSRLNFALWEDELRKNSASIAAWASVAAKAVEVLIRTLVAPIRIAFNLGEIIGNLGMVAARTITWNEALERMEGDWEDIEAAIGGVSLAMVDFSTLWDNAMTTFGALAGVGTDGVIELEAAVNVVTERVSNLNNTLVNFTRNFADRIGRATSEGTEAFDGFFKSVIAGFARLAAEMALFNALQGLFPNSKFISALGGSLGVSSGGATSPSGAVASAISGAVAPPGRPSGSVFNQNVNFNVAAIDGQSVAAVLREQKGTIVAVVAEAAQATPQLRRVLRGG